jgi:dienelactone hydrolase
MKAQTMVLLAVVLAIVVAQAQPVAATPEIITVPSGNLQLKAYFWKPAGPGPFPAVLFSHGSGGADADHTAGMTMIEGAEALAPVFVRHGYAFFYLCRRGQGLSADQAPFMQDVLRKEEAAKGKEASRRLQLNLLTGDHLDDTMAGLAALKKLPGIDADRIGIVGHSFGGQLALLAAERDPGIRAAVTFAAAAASWNQSPDLRELLLAAVGKTKAAIMLIHAQNDFALAPGRDLGHELKRLNKPYVLKIYPAVGKTEAEGHNFLYEAVPEWEPDIFNFLDEHMSRSVPAAELARLRPVVKRDLKPLMQRVWNIDNPSGAELENEFLHCHFTPLKLGSLGPAVLVEDNSDHGRESLMINIYVPGNGSYNSLIKESGVGPIIVPGPGSAPDIVFGTAGVCYSLWRYRYSSGRYHVDACIRREQDPQGNCVMKSCGKSSFPDPYKTGEASDASPTPSPYFAGRPRTEKQIMDGAN